VFAAFFARLLKGAGSIKTRAGDLVTLDAHFSGIAQWQNVSRPSLNAFQDYERRLDESAVTIALSKLE
jgi:hypothetical protein